MNRYFDICATTPIDAKVLSFLNEESKNVFGNPSSIHGFGQKSKAIIERARINVAKSINCIPSEIIFTSGGSISNNIALMGTLKKGDHFITSSYEHPAILNVIPFLKKTGVSISLIKPNKDGLVEPLKIKNEINSKTKLVSIMHINNEIGTINHINEISDITNEHGVLFHTDAVQAMGKVVIDMQKGNINLMSLSGHKFYAPKGVGILYVKDGTHIEPTLFGGGQESDLFPGTENIVNIDFSVFWVIKDAGNFLFKIQDPEGTVKAAAETAMREVIAKSAIQPILTEGRSKIEVETQAIIQTILDDYESGIQITQVQTQKADPPDQVIDAFRDVQAARADMERSKNEAEAYANDVRARKFPEQKHTYALKEETE